MEALARSGLRIAGLVRANQDLGELRTFGSTLRRLRSPPRTSTTCSRKERSRRRVCGHALRVFRAGWVPLGPPWSPLPARTSTSREARIDEGSLAYPKHPEGMPAACPPTRPLPPACREAPERRPHTPPLTSEGGHFDGERT